MDLKEFVKQKEFLICVDSDGCAMDTMDIKHIRCFGPCMVAQWGLSRWEAPILARWNEINLYSATRGINRFQSLAMILGEINGAYVPIEDYASLEQWVQTSPELSNGALRRRLKEGDSVCLRKALAWSEAVNAGIDAIPFEEKKPFEGVREALEYAHAYADIAIVSSANQSAVEEEWERYGLLAHVDLVLSQNVGSKAFCIGELMKKGYEAEHVMMAGDAPGDRAAAEKNGVFFYPILVRHEAGSWKEFREIAVEKLCNGSFGGVYQEEKLAAFTNNLEGK